MNNIINKRENNRYSFNIPIIFKTLFSTWERSYTSNISKNGTCLTSFNSKIEKNSKIKVCIQTPDYNIDNFPEIDATIIWKENNYINKKKFTFFGTKFNIRSEKVDLYLESIINKFNNYNNHLYYLEKNDDYKILYIEDNPSLLKLFKILSKEYNFNGYLASTMNESLEIIRKVKPNIILTDIHLPDFNIMSLISQLKTHNLYKKIPIIACSVTYPDIANKFLLLGGSKFVNDKPTSLEKLNKILKNVAPTLKDEGYAIIE